MTAKRDNLYGSPTGTEPVGSRRARPKIGPADPATRRAALDKVLSTPTKATGVAKPNDVQREPAIPRRSTYDQLKLRGQDIDTQVGKRDK